MNETTSLHVKETLLKALSAGKFGTKKALPSVRSIAESLRVSTRTVQKAVRMLCADGVLQSKALQGLFVKNVPDFNAGLKHRVGFLTLWKADSAESGRYPGPIVKSLRDVLKHAGFELVVASLGDCRRVDIVSRLGDQGLDGLMIFEIHSDAWIQHLKRLAIPMVSVDFDASRFGVPSLTIANAMGTFAATKCLIEQGHRIIAYLGRRHAMPDGAVLEPLSPDGDRMQMYQDIIEDERLLGYELAMHGAGLDPVAQEAVFNSPYVARQSLELLARWPVPTACVCFDDWLAQGLAVRAIRQGFKVPENLSFVGFGDMDVEFAPRRKIASVHVDYKEMGRKAAELILEQIGKGDAEPRHVVQVVTIVQHDSVAPPMSVEAATVERLKHLVGKGFRRGIFNIDQPAGKAGGKTDDDSAARSH